MNTLALLGALYTLLSPVYFILRCVLEFFKHVEDGIEATINRKSGETRFK